MLSHFILTLRNAVVNAKNPMRMTEELYLSLLGNLQVIGENRAEVFGLGEDVATKTSNVTFSTDRYVVDALALSSGTLTFAKKTYAFDIAVDDVVLEGSANLTWSVVKSYPNDADDVAFLPNQMPLLTNNLQLVVTIPPGGYIKRAVVLQRLILS